MTALPRPVPTIGMVVAVATTVSLGVWQVQRHLGATVERERVAALLTAPPVRDLADATDLPRRATLHGCFVDAPVGLVTGGLHQGAPGYRLFQGLAVDRGPVVLVDRGWVPSDVPADALRTYADAACGEVTGLLVPVEGHGEVPPTDVAPGVQRWAMRGDLAFGFLPRVLGPPFQDMADRLSGDVADVVLLRGPEIDDPRERPDAPPPVGGYMVPVSRIHHRSYAAQWFAIALITLALWVWDWRFRRPRRPGAP